MEYIDSEIKKDGENIDLSIINKLKENIDGIMSKLEDKDNFFWKELDQIKYELFQNKNEGKLYNFSF